MLFQASPKTFSSVARAWLKRYTIGAAGRIRPRPRWIALAQDTLKGLDPLGERACYVARIHRPLAQTLIDAIAVEQAAPGRDGARAAQARASSGLKDAANRCDRAIYAVRIAKPNEREPQFLTWEEADELRSVESARHIARMVRDA